ncbi:hypothetical protein GWK36_07625 [Caldichromatium japonicum]|uniref:Uncharacterized protein n=1 Tax=Caldichromatium japonicum TaxID=2699430 RepID=A0A6G7VDC5_9GAMM|nr:hypothetical protein [Caldichromatium japonicum]QIK37876.1 hypothetical protein GWK36_07625 [Caldichromatium japonicum]
MSSAIELYEALTQVPDERTRAPLIPAAVERLEERYPHLPDPAAQGQVRKTELRIKREIESVRADLKTEIERVKNDLLT